MITRCTSCADLAWLALRQALWPDCPRAEHIGEMGGVVATPARLAAFVARDAQGLPVGLAEAAIRHDYVNGTESSPVAFLEGIYVVPAHRRQGTARALAAAVEQWGREMGCTELASDALLENTQSHAMHAALGFEETERVVFFRKRLG